MWDRLEFFGQIIKVKPDVVKTQLWFILIRVTTT